MTIIEQSPTATSYLDSGIEDPKISTTSQVLLAAFFFALLFAIIGATTLLGGFAFIPIAVVSVVIAIRAIANDENSQNSYTNQSEDLAKTPPK